MLRGALALLVVSAGLLAGCAETVRGRSFPALSELRAPISKVAIVPLEVRGALARELAKQPEAKSVGGALIARHLAEALAARGVSVVPAGDVARALSLEGPIADRDVRLRAARMVSEKFGADAVLLGQVSRFVERSGEAAGSLYPASVSFEVTLYAAPGGEALWSGAFDETQRALSENVFNAGRYPGGGTRWLSAEQLAHWGASEVASAVPLGR